MDESATHDDARTRVSHYLQREAHLPPVEAERRADEVLALLGRAGGLAGVRALFDHWWLFLLRGGVAILFGILLLVEPVTALMALVLVFGAWAFIDGMSALVAGVTGWRSWPMVLAGLLGIAIGVFTFWRPAVTAVWLYAAFAVWAIARGILEIGVAIELRKELQGEAWFIIGGLLSILFGALLIILPVAGVFALAWLIGIYGILFGVLMVGLAVGLHRARGRLREGVRPIGGAPLPV